MKITAPILTDEDRATIAQLASRCAHLRTSEVIRAVEGHAPVRQLQAGAQESRDRAAYIAGAVVAEVAIARARREAA